MKINKFLPAIILAFLLIVMAITNPSKEHFKEFAKQHMLKRNFTEKDIKDNLVCQQTSNYIILSQFNFQIMDNGVPMQGSYIGIFGGFLPVGNITANEGD